MRGETLPPDLLLRAYAVGVFPMAESAQSRDIYWFDPEQRGILPLDGFHIPRRLRRTVRAEPFRITADRAFDDVMRCCGEVAANRRETWINAELRTAYGALHRAGHAHSLEAWQGDALVGGLYGVSLGAAFFGESMFARARDASKICLVHLVARLRLGGYRLLDTQFVTDHLARFGATEIARDTYREVLARAIRQKGDFYSAGALSGVAALSAADPGSAVGAVTQSSTQIS